VDLEVVTIGTELLLGFLVDTNAAWLGQALSESGIRVTRRTSVPDDRAAIAEAVALGLRRTRFVITSGGLGPTSDDVTREAVAALFGLPLEFQPAIWEELQARFARIGRALADRNRCQAEVPRGAVVLPNPRGTAPGLWVSGEAGEVVMLPGVPRELSGLVTEEVVPRLRARSGGRVVRSRVVRTTGIPESRLAERIAHLEPTLPPLTVAYLPILEGVDLRLTAWDLPPDNADRLLLDAAEKLQEVLGEHVYATGEGDLAAQLLDACRSRRLRLAVAESCTGGLIAARITAIPGSSDVFVGGMVTYADQVKEALGVPARILEAHGAVSEETAAALAAAVRTRYRADLAVGVTGIAGPGGGSTEKPIGLVWFGVADGRGVETRRHVFPGSRHEVRARATQFALWSLWRRALSSGSGPGSQ